MWCSRPEDVEPNLDYELDRWAGTESVRLLEAPEDVKRYRAAFLTQARSQLEGTHG